MATEIERLRKECSPDVIALNRELFDADSKQEPRRNKFNAHKVEADGIIFDSKSEYRRWLELMNMEKAGLISDLQRQVRFVLQEAFVDGSGKKQREISYTCDFQYTQEGMTVIEDRKSVATSKEQAFRMRWRLLLDKFKDDPSVRCLLT